MPNDEGPLVPADEGFHHQIVQTHAHVGQSDHAWTEKVCAMAAARDGSLQMGFGMGKYANRNVLDAYGGVSRGAEQWTVRGSRRLAADPATTAVGPIHYEVLEPLHAVRFRCEANDAQPISFEWVFEGIVPPALEDRHTQRARGGFRLESDLLRYHQTGRASGWLEVDGDRTEFDGDSWISTRDHSWGVRHDVGTPLRDIEPSGLIPGVSFRFNWCPMFMEQPDGDPYAIHHFFREIDAFGYEERHVEGGIEHADGRVEPFARLRPDLRYDPVNRRVLGGMLHFTMADGTDRPIEVEALGDTGLHLGAGLYFGLDGHHHGEWRGDLNLDGEYVADCRQPDAARRLHQIRDAVMRVRDPVGGGEGWANLQTTVYGAWPDLGLDEATSFI